VADSAKGMRTFRVSRMEGATVLAAGFKRPARFDLAEYWKRSTESLQRQRGGYPVTLQLADDSVRRLALHCKVTLMDPAPGIEEPGWITVRADFDGVDQARFVAMGLGARARVLDPPELRLLIQSEVAGLAAAMG